MSNIVFSFDAETYGILTAIDSVVQGFDTLASAVDSVVSSFANIASQSATLMTGLGGLISNFGALSGVMNDSSGSMGSAGSSAANLAYQLQQLAQRAADAAQAHKQAVQNIQQQEANLTQTTQEQIASREQTYDQSLHNMIEQHAYSIQQIADQENKLTQTYQETIDKRLQALNDPKAMQHKYIVDALQQQIDAALATGNIGAIAGLQAQLDTQNALYSTYITKTVEPYYKDLDLKGYQANQDAVQNLQNRLTQENTLYAQHLSDLQSNYDKQLALTELHYKQEEAKLAQHLTDENIKYAEQVARINNERAHIVSSGGGGGSGGSVAYGSPPTDAFIALFKQLGINPNTPQGAIAGENALQAWLTGGSYGTTNFGSGYAPKSQMSIQQLWSAITQGIAYGQDPTKDLGGGNLLDVISNLMVNAQVVNGKNPTAAFNSILSIFEKAESGNTIGLERQLAALGISPELLQKYGVKFGGRGGKTIQNPAAVLGALEQIGLSPGFAGQGIKQSMDTPAGAQTRLRDLWTSIVTSIIGNANDPASIMHRFMEAVNRLIGFLQSHRQDVINFGKTVSEWLLGKFNDFISWLSSSQAKSVLHDISKGFHDIGDALHWMGQHKDVLILLAGLLGAQAGTKLLGGLGAGLLQGGQGFMSGGLFGGIIPGTRGGLLQGAGGVLGGAGGLGVDGLLGLLNHFGMHGMKPIGNLTGDVNEAANSPFNLWKFFNRGTPTSPLNGQFRDDPSNPFDAMFKTLSGKGASGGGGKGLFEAASAAIKIMGDAIISAKNVYVTGPVRGPGRGGGKGMGQDAENAMNEEQSVAPLGKDWTYGHHGGWAQNFQKLLGGGKGVGPSAASGVGEAENLAGGGAKVTEEAVSGGGGFGGFVKGLLRIGPGAGAAAGGEAAAGGGGMLAGLGPMLAGIGPALAGIAAAAGPILLVVGLVAGLVAVLVMNRQKIMPFIHTLQLFFGKQLKDAAHALAGFAHEVQSRLGAAFGPGSVAYTFVMLFAHFWAGAWNGIKLVFSGIWDVIKGIIQIVWSIISNIILIGLDILGGKWGNVWNDIKHLLKGVWDGIVSILGGVFKIIVGLVLGFLGGLWGMFGSGLQKVGAVFLGFFQGLWGFITGPLASVAKNIGLWLVGVGQGFVTFFTQTIPQALGQAFSGMGKLLKVGIDFLIDHVLPGPLQGPVHSALGFAEGGMYPGGHVAVVGEMGPELFFSNHSGAVVSNAQIRQALLGSAGGGGRGQSITLNNAQFTLPGVRDARTFYQQMNKWAGKYAEHGTRGALN